MGLDSCLSVATAHLMSTRQALGDALTAGVGLAGVLSLIGLCGPPVHWHRGVLPVEEAVLGRSCARSLQSLPVDLCQACLPAHLKLLMCIGIVVFCRWKKLF